MSGPVYFKEICDNPRRPNNPEHPSEDENDEPIRMRRRRR
jgi:hypothetical protein